MQGFLSAAWPVVGLFNQRKSNHTKKSPPGEAEGEIEWDLAEKPYDEHRLCDPIFCQASLAALLQAIVIDKVHTVVRRQTLGSNYNSNNY